MKDPKGRRATFSYDGSNKIRRWQEAGGRITSFSVDGGGLMVRWLRPDGTRVSLGYDNHDRLNSWVRPLGARTTFTNSHGIITAAICPLGLRTSYSFASQLTVITTPGDLRTSVVFDVNNRVKSVTDPQGTRTSYSWSSGFLTQVFDARNTVSGPNAGMRLAYTTLSGLAKRINELTMPGAKVIPATAVLAYDGSDRLKRITDVRGNTTTLIWSGAYRRDAIIDPLLRRTSYSHNALGQLTSVINPLLQRVSWSYDALGRLQALIPLPETTSAYLAE